MNEILFMPFHYDFFYCHLFLISLDLNWIYSSKIKTKFSQVTSKVKSPFLFRRTKIIEIPLRIE